MPKVEASLSVNREHLMQALKQIKRLPGIGEQPAVLTYADGQLEIALGGCSFQADAQGDWRGQVKVPVSFIRRMAAAPPEGKGPIPVLLDGERLKIGEFVTKCKWDGLTYPRIELRLGATLFDKLVLRLTHSTEDIDRSDLTEAVEAAESERDKLIEKATNLLAEVDRIIDKAGIVLQPLGITQSKIRRQFLGGKLIDTAASAVAIDRSEIRRFLKDLLREKLSETAGSS